MRILGLLFAGIFYVVVLIGGIVVAILTSDAIKCRWIRGNPESAAKFFGVK